MRVIVYWDAKSRAAMCATLPSCVSGHSVPILKEPPPVAPIDIGQTPVTAIFILRQFTQLHMNCVLCACAQR